jgi:hypothetical protein
MPLASADASPRPGWVSCIPPTNLPPLANGSTHPKERPGLMGGWGITWESRELFDNPETFGEFREGHCITLKNGRGPQDPVPQSDSSLFESPSRPPVSPAFRTTPVRFEDAGSPPGSWPRGRAINAFGLYSRQAFSHWQEGISLGKRILNCAGSSTAKQAPLEGPPGKPGKLLAGREGVGGPHVRHIVPVAAALAGA